MSPPKFPDVDVPSKFIIISQNITQNQCSSYRRIGDGSIDKMKILKGRLYLNNPHKTKLKENMCQNLVNICEEKHC
jgi:hypothetical protein